jgi:hypothetical protein
MEKLRVPLLILLVLLIIAAGWLSQLGLSIENTFLARSFYDDLFKKIDLSIYARLMMQEELMKELPFQLPDFLLDLVSDVLGSIYDDQWLKGELIVVIDDMILFVRGKGPEPDFLLDLTEKNQQFRYMLKGAWDQGPKNILNIFGFGTAVIDDASHSFIDNLEMPAYFDLNEYFRDRGFADDIIVPVKTLKEFRKFYLSFPYIAFVFLFALIMILEGIIGAFRWSGSAILISGVTFFLLLKITRSFYTSSLEKSMAQAGIIEAGAMIDTLNFALDRAAIIPLYFVFFGLSLIAISLLAWFISRRNIHPYA